MTSAKKSLYDMTREEKIQLEQLEMYLKGSTSYHLSKKMTGAKPVLLLYERVPGMDKNNLAIRGFSFQSFLTKVKKRAFINKARFDSFYEAAAKLYPEPEKLQVIAPQQTEPEATRKKYWWEDKD